MDLRQAEKDGKKGIREFLSWVLSTPIGEARFPDGSKGLEERRGKAPL